MSSNLRRGVQNPFALRGNQNIGGRKVNYNDYRYQQRHRGRQGSSCSPSMCIMVVILGFLIYGMLPASQPTYYYSSDSLLSTTSSEVSKDSKLSNTNHQDKSQETQTNGL